MLSQIFEDALFAKHILVNKSGQKENTMETLFSLANLFNIRITSGQELATEDMIRTAARCIGRNVPNAFYLGFPQSVRELAPEALLFDQLVHYWHSYVLGDLSEAGVSLLEEQFERTAFREKTQIKDFSIVSEAQAWDMVEAMVEDLLSSTRPLSESQYELIREYVVKYRYEPENCASKDTAVKLLLETRDRDPHFARFLQLSDVIRVLDIIQFEEYGSRDIKKLNLRNQDRKFLTRLIDFFFEEVACNVIDCFEKQKFWNGLLHHIHYKPVNAAAEEFVNAIRGSENLSVYSRFEKKMLEADIQGAVATLRRGKGSGAVLRKLTYLLSRCQTREDVDAVLKHIQTDNTILLLQLLRDYTREQDISPRTFKFTKHNRLRIHAETEAETGNRKSWVSEDIRQMVYDALRQNLEQILRDQLGKVYVDPAMEKIALPLQETTSSGGYGVLPRGSRIPVVCGKKIRCFTYWEKVNDIDLSVIGLTGDNRQIEFSWRSMWGRQSAAVTFSGDQTRGYDGGSEFFDVDIEEFRKEYPHVQYLVFCNNVYSGTPFSSCVCRVGYMDRDILDSGEIFEPKTVATSFAITGESTFAYLFGLDLETRELVWLNICRDSSSRIAGTTSLAFLKEYFQETELFNVADLFRMLASQVVENPAEAEIIVSDQSFPDVENAEQIHSYDFTRILALINQKSK